jgi:uncharacterized protein
MAVRADKIFVNLPVKDLNKSVEFFTKIGLNLMPNLRMKMQHL